MCENGLLLLWYGLVYCNPPFSRGQLQRWIAKMLHEWEAGNVDQLVALIPFVARSKGFNQIVDSGAVLLDIGKQKFGGSEHLSPFPVMFCLWGVDAKQVDELIAALKRHGVERVTRWIAS